MSAEGLVLFDIDGTLLRRSGPHHRQVLVDAVRAVAGCETTTEGIPLQGMLDRDIIREMLRNAGIRDRAISAAMPEIILRAQRLYVRRCPDLRAKVCPGARQMLYRLHRRGIPAGLVTGNLTKIGWMKMERAGLKQYLGFGAFAEMGRDRASLVKLAIHHARKNSIINKTTPIALVGDHPNDINAAKANGIRSVAVATGVVGIDELATHGPDLLVEDLRRVSVDHVLGKVKS